MFGLVKKEEVVRDIDRVLAYAGVSLGELLTKVVSVAMDTANAAVLESHKVASEKVKAEIGLSKHVLGAEKEFAKTVKEGRKKFMPTIDKANARLTELDSKVTEAQDIANTLNELI